MHTLNSITLFYDQQIESSFRRERESDKNCMYVDHLKINRTVYFYSHHTNESDYINKYSFFFIINTYLKEQK